MGTVRLLIRPKLTLTNFINHICKNILKIPKPQVKISNARQQMRRDRALAAKKKMNAADTSKDDIFLFQVGKKGKVVDATEVTSQSRWLCWQ